MKKDIIQPKVTDVAVAIIPSTNELNQKEWNVYLINMKDHQIENVLVNSSGYGTLEGRKLETTELRKYFEAIPAKSYIKVEPIMEDVFKLTNQFWVSFYIGREVYDKKYIFVPDSINDKNLTEVPMMDEKGVMIK